MVVSLPFACRPACSCEPTVSLLANLVAMYLRFITEFNYEASHGSLAAVHELVVHAFCTGFVQAVSRSKQSALTLDEPFSQHSSI